MQEREPAREPGLMADVGSFLSDIYQDWFSLMNGLAALLLATFAASTLNNSLPAWTFWFAAGVCLIIACFRVWRIEKRLVRATKIAAEYNATIPAGERNLHQQTIRELQDCLASEKKAKEQLASESADLRSQKVTSDSMRGMHVKRARFYLDNLMPIAADLANRGKVDLKAARELVQSVDRYFLKEGNEFAPLFRQWDDLGNELLNVPPGLDGEADGVYRKVKKRIIRLESILE
jgi:hypothetical protein